MYHCNGCNKYFEEDKDSEITDVISKLCDDCKIKSKFCMICGKEIKNFDTSSKTKPEQGMWEGGIVDKISANYGSTLDGNMYIIAICDSCMIKHIDRIEYVGNYMENYRINKQILKIPKVITEDILKSDPKKD